MLNPFFQQGSPSEKSLIQDLINEQLKIYGVEVHYLPRKYLTENTVIKEVIQSMFDDAYPIEAYVNNYDGYGNNPTILSKFGIQSLNELTLTISRERFQTYIRPLIRNEPNIKLSTRPKEGDLIYFPLGNRIFEIKYVEHEIPFYQLQGTYTYELRCELFRYEDEVIDTGILDIDGNISGDESGSSLDSDSPSIGFGLSQTLTLVGTGVTATAYTGIVNGGIRFITVTNRGGGYSYSPRVAISSAPSGGTTGIASATMIGGIVVCNDNLNPANKSVQSVEVINPEYGYTIAPKIAFFGDGVGAAATSTIGNGIVGIITISNAGSGYITPPQITFSGISSVSAAATAVVSSAGTISQIRITNAGLGYTEAPLVTISSPSTSSFGDYIFNEIVTGSSSGTTARVRKWNSVTNKLEVSVVSGSFTLGENIIGSTSGASHALRIVNTDPINDGYSENSEIEIESEKIIDFSETNPFGMP